MFKWLRAPITWGGFIATVLITAIVSLTGLAYGIIKFFNLELPIRVFIADIKGKISKKLKR